MNERRHSTPAADKGRGRGSAGRALIADDHSIQDEGGEINLTDVALEINMKAEALCDRLIDELPPHIRPRVWTELHQVRRDAIRWQDENTFAWTPDGARGVPHDAR